LRGGPVRSHLASIVDSTGAPTVSNLDLLGFAKVQRIVFDEVDRRRAVGITYLLQPADPSAAPTFVPLAAGGRIILAAGALMSPRLLLQSGVGPFHRQDEIFPDGFSVPFHIHNPAIGTSLFDHVGTSLTYEYTGATPPLAAGLLRSTSLTMAPPAFDGRSIRRAISGVIWSSVMPKPVVVGGEQGKPRTRQPNVEVFVNPFGVGAPGGPYAGRRTLSVYAMLLRPHATATMQIDRDGIVKSPPIYLTDERDLGLMTKAIQQLLVMFRDNPGLEDLRPRRTFASPPEPRSPPRIREYVREPVGGWRLLHAIEHQSLGGTCPPGTDQAACIRRHCGSRDTEHPCRRRILHPAPLSAHPVLPSWRWRRGPATS
jgi:hypothetical protein